ncbi:MAG: GldG family protein [Eubacterium sp.]|nr:GldG family protein [Eubacterium sp.]
MKTFDENFKNRKFKMGGYQTLIMIIVLVVVIFINLVVSKIDITVDLSSDQKYTLTEDTKKFLGTVKDKIKLYYMCEDGEQNKVIEKVLQQYNRGNVEVVDKDPIIYPSFSKEFTDDKVNNNDVIVVNENNKKSRHVLMSDMYITDMNYNTYTESHTLDAEGQITAAIEGVTSAKTKNCYYTSGHNEVELSSAFKDILNKSNYKLSEFAANSAEKLPADCDVLIVSGPEYDFSDAEYNMISEYLKGGGKAMIFINPTTKKGLKNFNKIMADYGVDVCEGCVMDIEEALTEKYPTVFIPKAAEHDITAGLDENTQTVVASARGMLKQSNVRSSLTVDSLLTTADSAYSKTDITSKVLDKEKNDVNGPFDVAVAIKDDFTEKTKGQGLATNIVVFGSANFIANEFISTKQYGNRTMIVNSMTYLTGQESSTLAIPQRNLDQEMVSIKDSDKIFFTAFLVVIIPLGLLITGFVIWFKRRKN